MRLEEQIPFLTQLAKALAVQFGSQCEVVVHDLTHGSENTILAIQNGHVSGRNVGDGASPIVLRALGAKEAVEDKFGYLIRTRDGRLLKSSSIFLRDENGHAIALLSINFDITEITHANLILEQFVSIAQETQPDGAGDSVFSSVSDVLDTLIEESAEQVGKPVALMNKEDKIKAVQYLDNKGAFLIKKSGDRVAKFYDISKYTLYNYLGAETDTE